MQLEHAYIALFLNQQLLCFSSWGFLALSNHCSWDLYRL